MATCQSSFQLDPALFHEVMDSQGLLNNLSPLMLLIVLAVIGGLFMWWNIFHVRSIVFILRSLDSIYDRKAKKHINQARSRLYFIKIPMVKQREISKREEGAVFFP
jgi:hypothetical protein